MLEEVCFPLSLASLAGGGAVCGEANTQRADALLSLCNSPFAPDVSIYIFKGASSSPVRCGRFFNFHSVFINAIPPQDKFNIFFCQFRLRPNDNRFEDIFHLYKFDIQM